MKRRKNSFGYTESDLIAPALEILLKHPDGVTTSFLIKVLTEKLQPTGRDLEILRGRRDVHFSQKVRNLKSHNTLAKKGLADYSNRKYKITQRGKEFLESGYGDIASILRDQGFEPSARDKEFRKNYEGLIIEEGIPIARKILLRRRSRKLTKFAKKHFTKNGKIMCTACSFDFSGAYDGLGEGYIEIHHLRPIHEYEITGEREKISSALKKLAPLCSNCHRMVHRRKGELVSLDELRKIIKDQRELAIK